MYIYIYIYIHILSHGVTGPMLRWCDALIHSVWHIHTWTSRIHNVYHDFLIWCDMTDWYNATQLRSSDACHTIYIIHIYAYVYMVSHETPYKSPYKSYIHIWFIWCIYMIYMVSHATLTCAVTWPIHIWGGYS